MKTITVVVIDKPGSIREVQIQPTLKALQGLVDGLIQPITLWNDFTVIVNEEGIIRGMDLTIQILDIELYGPVVFSKLRPESDELETGLVDEDADQDDETSDWISLTPEEVQAIKIWFRTEVD